MPPVTWRINERGHFEVGGCDTVELAERFGTPLYVMDVATLRDRAAAYLTALPPERGRVYYASKAFLTLAVARLFHAWGLGLDVVSGGELYLALRAGVPAEALIFHGNNKTPDELQEAIAAGIGRIVVDGFGELDLIDEIAGRLGRSQDVLVRVNPGIEAHTHAFIRTGQIDSKFGFPLEGGQARAACQRALALPHLRLRGLHAHIGSQILELEPFFACAEALMAFAAELWQDLAYWPEEVDLGGGLGISYTAEERPPAVADLVHGLLERIERSAERLGRPIPKLLLEPGRSVVGEAGITLYRVGERKEIPGVRTYVAVDGGMGDNPRPALYQAVYEAVCATRALEPRTELVTLAGRNCESGDILIRDIWMPPLRRDDIVAVLATGAYNHSMASTYNRVPRPPVVLVENGRAELVQRRETYDDLLALERLPDPELLAASREGSR